MRSKLVRMRSARRINKSLSGIFSTVKPTSPYPSTYAGFPDDMDDWGCGHWKNYYLANKAIIGKDRALQIVDADSSSIGMWADGLMCKYDCAFTEFFEKEGLSVSNIFSKLYCAGENVVDAGANVVESAEGITDFVSSVANSKILLIGAALGGYYIYRRSTNG